VADTLSFGSNLIGPDSPAFMIAEIGINHNGSVKNALELIQKAYNAGWDAVKFQKRTPEICVPEAQKNVMRETPWGVMSYLDYRYRVELDREAYEEIDRFCKDLGLPWFVSCWDVPSVKFMEPFEPIGYKIASASLSEDVLLDELAATGRPLIVSTGMSTIDDIQHTLSHFSSENIALAHCVSTYPCPAEEVNLNAMQMLKSEFACPVGYSGHEAGLQVSLAAVALGASFVERHVTLDRTMWGSDQAASLEPAGMQRLVRDVRIIESALGDGTKRVTFSEKEAIHRLRK